MQVISLLPLLTASEEEHVTFITVPGFTGNCVVVSIVPVHFVLSPVHFGAEILVSTNSPDSRTKSI